MITIVFAHMSFSQNEAKNSASNSIFIEVCGVGGYGSLNYEKAFFSVNNIMAALKIGLGTYHVLDPYNKFNPDVIIPFTCSGVYGKNHKIEIGIGQTYSSIIQADLTNLKTDRTSNFSTHFSIGYRYQKAGGGMLFRCCYTPLIEYNRYYRHWAGVSFGYSF
jgi:hypothetical protein